ncbi:hypothetical protein FDB66_13645 [Clostridium botulinum]|nr:hypothetical protein [Clostridium botulinum]
MESRKIMRYMERRTELEREIKEQKGCMLIDEIRSNLESFFCCKIQNGFIACRLKKAGCTLTKVDSRGYKTYWVQ